VGKSDEIAPIRRNVPYACRVVATIYRSLGLDLTTELPAQWTPFPLVNYGTQRSKNCFKSQRNTLKDAKTQTAVPT